MDNVVINAPANSNFSKNFNLVVDNSGGANSTQLLSIKFAAMPSNTQISIPSNGLPINVAAFEEANLGSSLSIQKPGLNGGSYTISGTATFLKFSGQSFAYVNTPFTVKVNSGGQNFLLLEFYGFPWWILLVVLISIVGSSLGYLAMKRR